MRNFLLALGIALASVLPVKAACSIGGAPLNLQIPNFSDDGDVWAACLQYDFQKLSTAPIVNGATNYGVIGQLAVSTITGNAGGSGVYVSSPMIVAAPLSANFGITTSSISASGGIKASSGSFTAGVTASSFTALSVPGFKGDISNATGLPLAGLAAGIGLSSGPMPSGTYLATATWNNGILTGGGFVTIPSGGSGGSLLSTGTLSASATSFPLRNQEMFDSTFVNLVDSPTINATFVTFKNMGGITSAPTRTSFLSGSGTYTVPIGVSMLKIRMVGGGGGGGGGIGGTGGAANSTYFGSISTAAGGGGGGAGPNGAPGIVGTSGAGSASLRIPGGGGCGGWNTSNLFTGACGGNSAFGGGGSGQFQTNGNPGATNSGSGGGAGDNASAESGGGGGAGEYVELIVNSPLSSYTYGVSSGAAGGTGTGNGGAGAAGIIIIDEYYGTQGFSSPISTQVYPNGNISSGQTTMTTCVAGSTATWNSSGANAMACFSGSVSLAGHGNLALLLNGKYLPGYDSTHGFGDSTTSIYSFCAPLTNLAAGSNSICLTGLSNGATITIPGANTTASVAVLTVYEQKNTAGTGDVASGSNNSMSGTNTQIAGSTLAFNSGASLTLQPGSTMTVYGAFSIPTSSFTIAVSSQGAFDVTGGTTPTLSGCGASPTFGTVGGQPSNAERGNLTMGAGAASNGCTIGFPGIAFGKTPHCVMSCGGEGSLLACGQTANSTVGCDTVTTGVATACGTGTFVSWICFGQ
jgi:hypothetical protein